MSEIYVDLWKQLSAKVTSSRVKFVWVRRRTRMPMEPVVGMRIRDGDLALGIVKRIDVDLKPPIGVLSEPTPVVILSAGITQAVVDSELTGRDDDLTDEEIAGEYLKRGWEIVS